MKDMLRRIKQSENVRKRYQYTGKPRLLISPRYSAQLTHNCCFWSPDFGVANMFLAFAPRDVTYLRVGEGEGPGGRGGGGERPYWTPKVLRA